MRAWAHVPLVYMYVHTCTHFTSDTTFKSKRSTTPKIELALEHRAGRDEAERGDVAGGPDAGVLGRTRTEGRRCGHAAFVAK